MTLKNKFFWWTAIVLFSVLSLGTVSIWNVAGMWRTARAASAEYTAMDRAEATAVQVTWLRDSLRGADARTYSDLKYFIPIQSEVTQIVRDLETAAGVDDGDSEAELALSREADEELKSAVQQSSASSVGGATRNFPGAASQLEKLRQSLQSVAKLVPASARRHVTAASDRLRSRLVLTCFSLLIVLLVSSAIHVTQFRALVRPLLWLREDMRLSAACDYGQKVRPRGDREFKDVATYFNGLAKELAELYRGLEEKVIARSRELVRSERLASVGFLAAGVAHEINNPLSVISGYAELAARSLQSLIFGPGAGNGDGADAEMEAQALTSALEAQVIVRDEAFRCKEITSRLLSLARGNGEGRESLCLEEVARQVAVLTKGLRNYRDRRVILDFETGSNLQIIGNPTEMKQVLLNLTVNALEAVPAERGEVRIGGKHMGDWVEVFVADNGKGMSGEMLQHVFEPFFTAKRGAGEPGTGLGLSITHAIVENHDGRIRAESRGPGQGSRFTIRFPVATRAVVAQAGARAEK